MQIPDAIKVSIIKTTRLSILSEINPIGHWNKDPEIVTITINKDTSKLLKSIFFA